MRPVQCDLIAKLVFGFSGVDLLLEMDGGTLVEWMFHNWTVVSSTNVTSSLG